MAEASKSAVQARNRQGQSGSRKGKGKGSRPHCTYCDKNGHNRDTCWALHGRPPRQSSNRSTAHVAQATGDGLMPMTKK